ncbi:MAG: hypothetical protein E7458_04880 [Ruminococcaceae bacterium]|nr:hypothetical protein [Oscillospiraceae bacterium]
MKKALMILLVILLAAAILAAAAYLYLLHSPEYALKCTIDDVRTAGMEGLRPHLTEELADKMERVSAIGENKLIGGILSALTDSDLAKRLLSELQQVEWSLGDVLKNPRRARATICFSHAPHFSGSFDLLMQRIDGVWKISGIDDLQFDS